MPSDFKTMMAKAASFCAYQERSTPEVREKLESWECDEDTIALVLAELETQHFLNDKRYAELFAHSKLRQLHWGRIKIRFHLKSKHLPERWVEHGLNSIKEEEYMEILVELLQKKAKEKKEPDPYKAKQKLYQFALQKGFEPECISIAMREVVWDVRGE